MTSGELAIRAAQGFYVVGFALGVGSLLASLSMLHRVRELHHGYYGIALAAASLALPLNGGWLWLLRGVALVLVVDDAWQHDRQAEMLIDDGAPGPDDSPIHRAYVAAYRWVAGLIGSWV